MTSVSGITLTKRNGTFGSPSSFRKPSAPILTIRPVSTKNSGKALPLSSYVKTALKNYPDDGKSPSVEIIKENNGEGNHELPPGTKIITHPMTKSHGYHDTTIVAGK